MVSYNLLRFYNSLGIDPDKVPRFLGGGDLSTLSRKQRHSLLARILYDEAGHVRGAPLNLPGIALATAALGSFSSPAIVQAQQQSSYKPAATYEQSDSQNNTNQTTQHKEKIPFNVSFSADNLEQGKLRVNARAEGLVPVYRGLFNDDSLVGLQFTEKYGRFTDGKNTLEGAVGIVIGNRYNRNSASRIGVFYQDRHDTGKLNFGVASIAAAFQRGDGQFEFYSGFPITKRQLAGVEESTSRTSATSELTEEGITTTTTTTTQVDTRINSWAQARNVFTFSGSKNLIRDLRLKLGGAYYGGIKGGFIEYGNVTETTESVPHELRGILGFLYSPEFLSRFFRGNTQLSFEMRAGQGKPQYLGQLTINFNEGHKTNNQSQEARLLVPLHLEDILVATYKSTKETTTTIKSPLVNIQNCRDTAKEGERYVCEFQLDASGNVEVIKGHPSLSLSTSSISNLASLATAAMSILYSGILGYDDAGEFPIEMLIKGENGLSSNLKYVLRIENTNRKPSLGKIDPLSIKEGEKKTITISATDADKEDVGRLAVKAFYNGSNNLPTWVTQEQITDGLKLTFDPDYDKSGRYNFLIRVQDPGDATDEQELVVNVADINRMPTLAAIGSKKTKEGADLEFIISANDPDGNPLSFTASALPAGAVLAIVDALRAKFSWKNIAYNQAGKYNVRFSVSDNQGGMAYEDVAIEVDDVNRSPAFRKIGDKSLLENSLLEFTIQDIIDPDGDPVKITATGLPAGAVYNDSTRSFSWRTGFDSSGIYKVTFTADDDKGGTYSELVEINIDNVNRSPSFGRIDNKSGSEGGSITFTIDSVIDPDGDPVNIKASGLPRGAVYNDAKRQFSWNNIGFDQSGTYKLIFTAEDGKGGTYSESIEIAIGSVNRSPTFDKIGDRSGSENETLEFKILNISDPDGDSVKITASGLPTGATYNDPSRTFSWKPDFTQSGTYNGIKFTADDGNGGTYNESITIKIDDVNRAPVFNFNTAQSGLEGTLLQFTTPATDADGDSLTYSASNLPSGASYNASTQTFSWTPTSTQLGTYTPTISVSDGKITTSQNVTINITDVNRSPVLSSIGNKSINENSPLEFIISASDPDGDSLTYSASNLPSGASFNSLTRTFSWTPSYTQSGTYSGIEFKVQDNKGGSASESIAITVNNVNRSPTINSIGNKTVNENSALEFVISGSDPDGDSLTFSASNLPSGASFNTSTRTFSWTPSYTQSGTYSPTFSVTDGISPSSETISITVNDVNRAPSVTMDSPASDTTITAGQSVNLQSTASDPDLDSLVFSWSAAVTAGGPAPSISSVEDPGNIAFNNAGTYNLTVTVNDGKAGGSVTSTTRTITVNAAPPPPPG